MYNRNYDWNREMFEEERKLLNDVSAQRMSWNKLGKLIRLNAMLNSRRGGNYSNSYYR